MAAAVEVNELTRKFDSFTAVDRITLTVQEGEIFGFLGANGAGKTTAIRMLTGLLLPTSGSGRVAGYDVLTQSESIKKTIGYMSQKFSLYPDLTGIQNMQFYAAAYGLSRKHTKERIEELSSYLSLSEFINRLSGPLPLGWRQRLALAVSLLHEPKILFLDEPTSGVDPVFRRRFWDLLYELAERGVTIFVTTHYMDEAEFCGRLSIMHRGRIVAMGRPLDLIHVHHVGNLEQMFIQLISEREEESRDAGN